MPSSSKLSTTNLSVFILFLLIVTFLSPSSAFAQGSKRKSLYDPIEEKDKDRPDKRSEWLMRGRVAPKGQSAAALRLRAYQRKMAMRAAREAAAKAAGSTTAATASAGWVSLGPAPLVSDQNFYGLVSGRSTAIAIDPSDTTGNTVYAAAASGGVWKSSNAANATATSVNWTPVTDQQASLTNGAISVKSDGSVVLVGTGEPNSAIDSYYGVGILRSTDKGATWTLIPSADSGAHPFAGMGFTKFAWSTASGATNTVVAAAADAFVGDKENLAGNIHGLYLSTNAGQTWALQTPTDGSAPVSATDVVYNPTAAKFFAALRYHGVYSSTNGTSWTRLTNQPNPTMLSTTNCPTAITGNPPTCPMYRGQLAVVPGRNEMYFWFVDTNDTDLGIWQSTDGGSSWKKIDETGIASCGDTDGCGTQQAFYNLEISAVADGTATDIYVGAVNLFRCKLASGATKCSTVDSNLSNSWLNLTHVYGCSTKANVHPDEHGLDFLVVGGKDIMYFGNDGGIYRVLDGFTGLNVGSCSTPGTNQFDNLNANIGATTQFVSFSVHPTDLNIVIGGTQDNGSPATTTATTSSQFFTALGGDGGYNAIDPTTPTNWYNALTDVQIGQCTSAPSCNGFAFYNEVVSSATVGGDHGNFYTPYILDPQDSSEMLVGTCRVWRGTASGSGFSTLSRNFDTGDTSVCGGFNSNINLVRAVAAGGPKDANGFSNVVYATTDGYGPLYGYGTGGEVWVTTNAATTLMSNVTPPGNLGNNYAISSVAIDNSDATANTAYVGLMGFNTSHVWKTTTAGASGWTDWSANLPDSPVNDLLVDSQAEMIYAGTDVGIFASSTSSPSWTEVGPAPGSGLAGYLPNVPVSAIRIFDSGGVKKLRASTYGRGIWEFPLVVTPDFTLAVTASPNSTLINNDLVWHGTLTAVNGYSNTVNLTCAGAAPTTCNISPSSLVPAAGGGAAFTVTVDSSAMATYNFGISGTDGTITHSQAVSLTVNADFSVTNTGVTTQTVKAGVSGVGYSFTVTPVAPATSFGATITYACSGLDATTSCIFNPASIPATNGSTSVSLTITTSGPNTAAANIRAPRRAGNRLPWLPFTVPIAGVVMLGMAGRKVSKYSVVTGLCLALVLLGLLIACGGSSTPVSVSAVTPGSVSLWPNNAGWPSSTQAFSATASDNAGVTWSLSPSGASSGSIDGSGNYTAPQVAAGLPPTVTVRATSVSDSTKSNTATITLKVATVPQTFGNVVVSVTDATISKTQPLPPLTLVVQ